MVRSGCTALSHSPAEPAAILGFVATACELTTRGTPQRVATATPCAAAGAMQGLHSASYLLATGQVFARALHRRLTVALRPVCCLALAVYYARTWGLLGV